MAGEWATAGEWAMESVEGRIAELWTYPVKSCRGVRLEQAELGRMGLAHDRRWMVVRPDGRFLTQREAPTLARVVPSLEPAGPMLGIPGAGPLPLGMGEGPPLRVRVWDAEVDAVAPSPQVDEALSDFLGRPSRLAYCPTTARRVSDPAFATDAPVAFADDFSLLVTVTASLDALNEALVERGAAAVPMRRFRPNIVLTDLAAGAEDRHRRLTLQGGTRLDLVKRCDRCSVTTVDQDTGERTDDEPLRTLMATRRNPATGGAWFGQNAVAQLADGHAITVRVGDLFRLGDPNG